ncbi:hypothetical protein BDN70DRAFT_873267 [Pholiota conissans]|uniref:Uncharacterized protein n=1 Tax=Pholiota conissans TaxID=109636 RepID=A0A9P5Z9C0_9AGAR|nr:hypothetical protein BDN70DRAFT_873267 [Pholiota conissans]
MQRYKRDHGEGSGGGSSTSTSNTSRSSQSSVAAITEISTQLETATPTTIVTTLITSVNDSGSAPSTAHSSSNPTAGGVTPPPQNHSPSQSTPSGPATSDRTIVTVSSSPSSTSSPVFMFNDLANATVCNSFGLSWTYTGQNPVAITLTVQRNIIQSGSTTSTFSISSSGSPATMRILTTRVLSNADSFIWPSVDVLEGWYIAKASDTSNMLGISAGSAPFYVKQGSDTSCLLKVPTSTISTLPPNQSTPFSPSSSKPSIGTGDIVGITLGVIAGAICLLLAVFTLPRLRRGSPTIITHSSTAKPQRPYLLY